MDTLVSKAVTSETGAPSRNQRTVTLPGRALASQEKFTLSPSSFVWFVGGIVITAGPANSVTQYFCVNFAGDWRDIEQGRCRLQTSNLTQSVLIVIAFRICSAAIDRWYRLSHCQRYIPEGTTGMRRVCNLLSCRNRERTRMLYVVSLSILDNISLVDKKPWRIGERGVEIADEFAFRCTTSALTSLRERRSTGCIISSSISNIVHAHIAVVSRAFTPEEFQNLRLCPSPQKRISRCIIAEDRFSRRTKDRAHPSRDSAAFSAIRSIVIRRDYGSLHLRAATAAQIAAEWAYAKLSRN